MTPEMSQQLRVPAGMAPVRYKPPLPVHAPPGMVETPFIAPDDPAHKQVQQVWVAQTRMFDLSDEKQAKDYQDTWQLLSDGHGQVCEQRLDFDPKRGTYMAFLRWARYDNHLPGTMPTVVKIQPVAVAEPVNTFQAYLSQRLPTSGQIDMMDGAIAYHQPQPPVSPPPLAVAPPITTG